MVSTGQMIGMVLAILLPILAAVVPYVCIHKRSSKIETGMAGAVGYGFLGYLWQQLIYLMVIVMITNISWLAKLIGNNYVATATVYGLVCGIFVALGMYWGVYLTNQKQHSIYRSAAIGIGFGLGNIAWNIIAPYAMSLYYSIQINAGTYAGSEQIKKSILGTPAVTLYLDAFRCILFLLIYMGIALLLGYFYLEGNKIAAWGTPILVQFFISLSNALIQEYLPNIASRVVLYIMLSLLAAGSVWLTVGWLKTGEIPIRKQRK